MGSKSSVPLASRTKCFECDKDIKKGKKNTNFCSVCWKTYCKKCYDEDVNLMTRPSGALKCPSCIGKRTHGHTLWTDVKGVVMSEQFMEVATSAVPLE